jgi:hypothetical protein
MKLLEYLGGLGDNLMLSCVARELRVRGEEVSVIGKYPEVLVGNRDIKYVCPYGSRMEYLLRRSVKDKSYFPNYLLNFNIRADTRMPLHEHVLAHMCRQCGVKGEISLRTYIDLMEETWIGRAIKEMKYITIQTSGVSSQGYSVLKEWEVDDKSKKFQAVVNKLNDYMFVQIGSKRDYKLDGVIDMRGKTNIWESAQIIKDSRLFVGLEGFLMHLARAVDTRSVIIYGGRLKSWQIGYICNINIETRCIDEQYMGTGCWRQKTCEYGRVCMEEISVDRVVEAVREGLERRDELEVEKVTI